MKGKRQIGQYIASVLTAAMLFSMVDCKVVLAENRPKQEKEESLLDIIHETISYDEYLERYEKEEHPTQEIVKEGTDYIDASEDFYVEDDGLCTLEEGKVTYEFMIEEAGLYQIQVDYYPLNGKNSAIERELYINGEIPFENAQYLELSRSWTNQEDVRRDSRDNDVRPKQSEVFQWMKGFLKDSEGYYQEAFSFYFKEGINTITLVSIKEPMKIGRITLTQEDSPVSYEEYKAGNVAAGFQKVSNLSLKVQGEDGCYKSDSTLYPVADRTSPLTEPYHPSKTRLNTIGGSNWKNAGQWITWKVDVPESGLYEIALRYRQNVNQGTTVTRAVYIDGSLPFKEAGECKFYYKNGWQMKALGTEHEPYAFYLEEGVHTITMEVTLGSEMAEIIRRTDDCIAELNRAYRQLLMVIGSSPDTLRDYQLEMKTPEALEILKQQYSNICEIKELVDVYAQGSSGSQLAAIDNLVNQLATMTKSPKTIAKQWTSFKDNIVALGSWELKMKEQPLEIDYLLLCTPGCDLPEAEAGFFQKLLHELKQFIASFFEDYDSIGEVYEGEALDVWILADSANITSMSGSGRDQATVIKELVDNYFIPETNIPVNVKLVNKDVLLSATLAGEGPDVALNVAGKEPINYALRNAVVDLTQFDDFDEVRGWFHNDALTQFSFEDGVYALPQTMSFHVMFYRADILKDLGIEIPTTWDEYYEALSVIQKNNMNIGVFPDYTTFAMFLYQHGGEYYTEDGMASGLDSEEAVAAFKQWSGNYANYKMPVTFDFANRFRTGEMPIAIGDYTNYNYLSVFAPEIRGLWGFTVVPGMELEDGTIDRSVSMWETASVIMKTSEQKENAWKFLKWWMSAQTQADFGNEIENVLGISGRVATANLDALENLPWSNKDYKQLSAQMEWVKSIPEIPGSYYTERNIKNAFYTVYNNNEDPRETLQDIVKTINTEIDSKREEFGLPVRE